MVQYRLIDGVFSQEIIGNNQIEKLILEKNELSGEPFKQSAKRTNETIEINTGILFII